MKEKTFDELIEETPLHELLSIPEKDFVKELMQQVREATIAECGECLTLTGHNDIPLHWIEQKYKMNQLPTDRIKIENK